MANEKDIELHISKTFLPRRADTATMQTFKAGIVLSKGELFMEYPNSGPGTKGNYYFKVGDGKTPYKDLPYAFGMINENFIAFKDITLGSDGGVDLKSFEDYMENIKSGATFGDIISYLKAAIQVFNNEYTEHSEDMSAHLSEKDRKAFDAIAYPQKVNEGSLNDMKTAGKHYYADSGNDCTDKPNKNKVDAFGMDVYMTATGHMCQELTEDITGIKYVRIFNGSTWGSWCQLYTSANPPSLVSSAEKAQSDILEQRIDTTYVKNVKQKTTQEYVDLTHSDKDRQVKHTFTVTKGNDTESTFEFKDENTQYQMHVKNASNTDGNVKMELTSTDGTSNTVTMKGDGKGSKVSSNGDVVNINTEYNITIEPHILSDGVTQNGVDIVLTDINGNRKIVTLRSTDETRVTAVNGNEINFYIPNVAIERLVKVPNQTAMFALTRNDIQNGDSVLDLATSIMYVVVDDSNLNSISGYQEYTAHRATELTNPRKMDGVEFKGNTDITHYGVCSTAAGTAAKTVACNNFKLVTGARIMVKFSATNTATNPTLNVSGTGAKAITIGGGYPRPGMLNANYVYEFLYDGTNYEMTVGKVNAPKRIDGVMNYCSDDITHYGVCSTAAGTAAKTVACKDFTLVTGARILVKFSYANTVANPTLNVNGTGAKNIRMANTNIRAGQIQANFVYEFVYDGTGYELVVGRFSSHRLIDGVAAYGDADITHYGVCSTAAGTAAKTVACNNFKLVTGARVVVKFTITDTAGTCTLNVNNTGAKNIQVGGANIRANQLQANYVYEFIYTGSAYEMITARALFFDGGDEG